VELVATSRVVENKLRVIDAREVEGTGGLHLAHGEAERPRVSGKIIDDVIGEISAVHLGYDVVVINVGCVLKKGGTVDVERRGAEVIFVRPSSASRLTGDKVKRLDGVVKVAEINVSVSVGSKLRLCLGDEKLVLGISEILALISIEINVVTVNLGGFVGGETVAALDTNLDVVVLEGNERECLSPVLTKEEGNHVVLTRMVSLADIGCNRERSLGRILTHEGVVNTLNVKRIKLRHFLTTNPKTELCGTGRVVGEKTI